MSESLFSSLRKRWPMIILLLVQLLNGMVVAAQFYFFPIYVKEALGLSAVVVSTFVSVGQIAGLIASLLAGGLTDTLGRKWTLVLGLGCFVVGSLAFFIRLPWLVGALWFVNGMALSLEALGSQGYLIGVAGGASLGVTSALYHWGFTLGGAVGSPIAGRLLDTRGYGGFAPVVLGLAGGTTLIAAVLMPRLKQATRGEARASWRAMLAGYVEIVRQPLVLRLGMLRFLPTCYYGMAMVLIPLLINAETGSKTAVALFATAAQVLATLTQLIAGRIADQRGPRAPTLIAIGGVLSAALGLAGFAGQLWGLYLFGILGIAAAWALSTLMPVLVSGTVVEARQGRVLGALNLLWNLAMILSAMVGGALVEVRPGLPFALAALVNVGTVVIALAFFARRGPALAAKSRLVSGD
jgi:MFS family permease